MRGMTRETVSEMLDRKVVYAFGAGTLLLLLIIFVAGTVDFSFGGGEDMGLDEVTGELKSQMVGKVLESFMGLFVFLAVLFSASVIPGMLTKGRVDYYLSKPISRSSLLLTRILAVWTSYGAVIVICGLVGWVMILLVHEGTYGSIVYLLASSLFDLFVWVALTSLTAVLSGSTTFGVAAVFVVWTANKFLAGRELLATFFDSEKLHYLLDVLYNVLPKPDALFDLASKYSNGHSPDWMPLISSSGFAAVVLIWAVMAFRRKDF